jgi:hypothetical protein
MRELIVLWVGLAMVLGGAGAAHAREASECCQCSCEDLGLIACIKGAGGTLACEQTCEALNGGKPSPICAMGDPDCSIVAPCPRLETGIFCDDGLDNDIDGLTDSFDADCGRASAPAASRYSIAALLIVLAGFGVWRLRKQGSA